MLLYIYDSLRWFTISFMLTRKRDLLGAVKYNVRIKGIL